MVGGIMFYNREGILVRDQLGSQSKKKKTPDFRRGAYVGFWHDKAGGRMSWMNDGRTNLVNCQNSKYGFNRASTAKKMPDGPFSAADIDLVGFLLSPGTEKQCFDSCVLGASPITVEVACAFT
jgi:hypothetical protein